jgi:hypothetical protein
MGATERTGIVLDISAARLTVVGIGIEFGTAVRASNHTDRITTGGTIGCLGVVDGTTMGALHAQGSLHLHLLTPLLLVITGQTKLFTLSLPLDSIVFFGM